MRKFFLYSFSFLFPVFVGIPIVNYFVDPGHIYSPSYIDDIIAGLKMGRNVTNVGDLNERKLKDELIQLHNGDSLDYVIMGASRVMTISKGAFDGFQILNLGMSGSKIEDLVSLYQACKDNRVTYDSILIGVEATFFNGKDGDSRWKSLDKYYKEFTGDSLIEDDYSLINNLFSASYFKSCIKHIISGSFSMGRVEYVDNYKNDGFTIATDGSIYYGKKYRDRAQAAIDKDVKTWMHGSFNNFDSLDYNRVLLFDKFINVLRNDGVKVVFFKCPYHPLFYSRILSIKGMKDGFNYIDNYASKNGIRVVGSYNPDDVRFKNTDFYDAAHARKEILDSLIRDNLFQL